VNITARDNGTAWRCAPTGEATRPSGAGDAAAIVDLFSRATALRLRAQWRNADGSVGTGQGEGTVKVHRDDRGGVILTEEGRWSPAPGSSVAFRGGYRWEAGNDVLSVEHVRQGISRPVFLLEMVPVSPHAWTSRAPHRCDPDRYDAGLSLRDGVIIMSWQASGPSTDYVLTLEYGLSAPSIFEHHPAPAGH
jgi:hypothetical protein